MINMAISKGLKILIIVVAIAAASIYPVYLLFTPKYPDWNLTLSGDVSVETSLTYQELMEEGYTIVEDSAFQTLDKDYNVEEYTVTGFPLLTLVEELGISLLEYEAIMIIANDGYSKILTKSEMDTGENDQVVIAYKINGTINDPADDGYLRMMVNQSIIGGGSGINSGYCIKKITEVRFLPKWDLEIKVGSSTTVNVSYYNLTSSKDYDDIRVEDQYFNASRNGGLWKEFTATGIMLWNLTTADYLNLDISTCDFVNFTSDDGYEVKMSRPLIETYFNEVIIAYIYDGEFMLRPTQDPDANGPIRMCLNQTVISNSYKYSISNLRTIEFFNDE
jgi:hypothetical protein